MTNNQLIEEDWERVSEMDSLFLLEREKEIEEEYYNTQFPARIFVIKNKTEEYAK